MHDFSPLVNMYNTLFAYRGMTNGNGRKNKTKKCYRQFFTKGDK